MCEQVPVAKLVPGTIRRPIFAPQPEVRCRRVWVPESRLEPEVDGVTYYIRDLDQICLELDYPIDRCWEILAGLDSDSEH